MRLEVECLLTK